MNHLSSIARLAISLRMGNIWANEFCPVDVHVSFLDEVPPLPAETATPVSRFCLHPGKELWEEGS